MVEVENQFLKKKSSEKANLETSRSVKISTLCKHVEDISLLHRCGGVLHVSYSVAGEGEARKYTTETQ